MKFIVVPIKVITINHTIYNFDKSNKLQSSADSENTPKHRCHAFSKSNRRFRPALSVYIIDFIMYMRYYSPVAVII